MADRLTVDETLAMINDMAGGAERDSGTADVEDNTRRADYWEGWADGLRTLASHINGGVKVTCFPLTAGSCTCHPLTIRPATPEEIP
jgi:hypothetical protein